MDSVASFVQYYDSVQRRTERLVPLIPAGQLEWRPERRAFSFGDLLRHLAGVNRWMWAETVSGRPSRYPGHDAALGPGYEATCAYYASLQADAATIFRGLSEVEYSRSVVTPAGTTIAAWKWLRAMIEHEAHHRGQLYLMLRMQGVETPPIFGLNEDQVRRASSADAYGPRTDTEGYRPRIDTEGYRPRIDTDGHGYV
jgi:uncharacterized damage-inducible protein DinB